MLTVVLACDASGNTSTLRPLPRPYSVMPSTDGPWLTPGGSAACALQHNAAKRMAAHMWRIKGRGAIMKVCPRREAPIIRAALQQGGSEWAMDPWRRRKFAPERRAGGRAPPKQSEAKHRWE